MEIVVRRIAKKKTYTIGHLYILSDKDVKRTWRSILFSIQKYNIHLRMKVFL